MDVLHLIAVSLLLLQILFLLIKDNKKYFYVICYAAVITILATPYIWQIRFSTILPIEMASSLNNLTGSLFPVFPWLAYVFMGAALMQLLLEHPAEQKRILKLFFVSGIIMITLGVIPELLKIKTSLYYDFWQTSPNIFLIKFGIVLVLLFLFSWLCEKFNYEMKIFSVFGQESLFIYVIHLLMIYGTGSYTLQTNFGRSLNWLELGIAYILMISLLLVLGKLWGKLKKAYREKFANKV
jgi:uncharacterized membrane protein